MNLSTSNIAGSPLSTVVGLGAGGAILGPNPIVPPTGSPKVDMAIYWLQFAVGLATMILGALKGAQK